MKIYIFLTTRSLRCNSNFHIVKFGLPCSRMEMLWLEKNEFQQRSVLDDRSRISSIISWRLFFPTLLSRNGSTLDPAAEELPLLPPHLHPDIALCGQDLQKKTPYLFLFLFLFSIFARKDEVKFRWTRWLLEDTPMPTGVSNSGRVQLFQSGSIPV